MPGGDLAGPPPDGRVGVGEGRRRARRRRARRAARARRARVARTAGRRAEAPPRAVSTSPVCPATRRPRPAAVDSLLEQVGQRRDDHGQAERRDVAITAPMTSARPALATTAHTRRSSPAGWYGGAGAVAHLVGHPARGFERGAWSFRLRSGSLTPPGEQPRRATARPAIQAIRTVRSLIDTQDETLTPPPPIRSGTVRPPSPVHRWWAVPLAVVGPAGARRRSPSPPCSRPASSAEKQVADPTTTRLVDGGRGRRRTPGSRRRPSRSTTASRSASWRASPRSTRTARATSTSSRSPSRQQSVLS